MLARADQDLLAGVTGAPGEGQRRAIAKAITPVSYTHLTLPTTERV